MEKVLSTFAAVVLAVGISAGVWVGANILFALAPQRWRYFNAISGAILGFIAGVLLAGNRAIVYSTTTGEPGDPASALGSFTWVILVTAGVAAAVAYAIDRNGERVARYAAEAAGGTFLALVVGGFMGGGGLPELSGILLLLVPAVIAGAGAFVATRVSVPGIVAAGALLATLPVTSTRFFDYGDGGLNDFSLFIWFPLLMAGLTAGLMWYLAGIDDPSRRRLVGLGGGVVLGLVAGALTRTAIYPTFDYVALVAWTVVLAAIGAGLAVARGRAPLPGAVTGAALGWLAGAWGGAELGTGSAVTGMIGMIVLFALVGLRVGMGRNPNLTERMVLDNRARAWIFLGPAVFFTFVSLVIPTIRTAYLSLLDRRSEVFVGFQNYVDTFQDKGSFDPSGTADLFTSRPFYAALVFGAIGIALAVREKRQTGRAIELGGQSIVPISLAALLFFFGLFTAMRGTLINNLWWVVVVVVFSTVLGLAVAVLADGVAGEKFAKSMIFMPMAISLVGASIIWRFMYLARDTSLEQTGVLNAMWVGLGRMSTEMTTGGVIIGVLAVLATLGGFVATARSLVRRHYGALVSSGTAAALSLWFTLRWFSPGGFGGVIPTDDGGFASDTVFFIQNGPYNNFFLMIVLVWIQTGFAMVIFSAAIRAVPEDLLEAASVDGATESQIFWRVTLPQIASTIGVVVTTLIVVVMKVFDIVKVMTNGQFGTQVLANDMFSTAFNNLDNGRGAALAILILVSVLPVMIYNLRELTREA